MLISHNLLSDLFSIYLFSLSVFVNLLSCLVLMLMCMYSVASTCSKLFSCNVLCQHPLQQQDQDEEDENEEECLCGVCGELYEDETDEPQIWIQCDLCGQWLHCSCEQLSAPPPPESSYICVKCQK